MKTLLLSVLLLANGWMNVFSQEDYPVIFGNDYRWAVDWLKNNDQLIQVQADQFDIPAKELKAIVFPELIRYNRVYDAIEIESLRYLYVREGDAYADFSVGYFQMKPSFAEMIEADIKTIRDHLHYPELKGFISLNSHTEAARKTRLDRLSDIQQQTIYLCLFYKICQQKYPSEFRGSSEDRIRTLATRYNAGYRLPPPVIQKYRQKKHFQGYNYASISLHYYNRK